MYLSKFKTKKCNIKWKNGCYNKKKIQKNLLLSYKNNTTFYHFEKGKNFICNKKYKPTKIDSNIIEFELIVKKSNKLKIFFDKNSLEFKGWETKDAYTNNVSFIISNLKTNKIIEDGFFKIPKEKEL